jgi:hypothetical protein
MAQPRSYLSLKIGLLVVAIAWFLFSFHELFKGAVNIGEYAYFTGPVSRWILMTDVSGFVGLVSRTAAGLAAVAAILFFAKKGLSAAMTRKTLRWILIAEAIYWLSLFLSGVWGFLPTSVAGIGNGGSTGATGLRFNIGFLIETGIPCLVESIAVPVVLFKLVSELNPEKPAKGAVKWGLIAGAVYVFVFWLDNTCNWIYVIMEGDKGVGYLTAYPETLLSFVLTTVGLLAVGIYTAYFTRKSIGTETLEGLKLKTVGVIIVLVGSYFLWNYLTWIFFGTPQSWSAWYAWFLGHNMNLWVLSLPIVGLPLLFAQKNSQQDRV